MDIYYKLYNEEELHKSIMFSIGLHSFHNNIIDLNNLFNKNKVSL